MKEQARAVNEPADTRGDVTHQKILDAASRQFATHPFNAVSLDDVVADADVSKGALYFHFRSKHLLALAVIEHHAAVVRASAMELLTHQLSGLETLIEITFMVATLDTSDDYGRAAANLQGMVRRPGGPNVGAVDEWMKGSISIVEKAMADGDVRAEVDPETLAQLLVSHYVGVRQVSDMADTTGFMTSVKDSWCATLPGFANPDRVAYLTQFVERRAIAAIRSIDGRR